MVDDIPIGCVTVAHMEDRHGTGWVSYWMSASSRGRGLATRAVATAAEWALVVRGLHRLELGHRVDNPASCRVATQAGFAVEGVEREKLRYGDVRVDVETHARLASDPATDANLLRILS